MCSLPPARIDGEKAFVSRTEKRQYTILGGSREGYFFGVSFFFLSTRGLEIRGTDSMYVY